MVQILPAQRTFGSEFGKAFGGGLGQGFSEGMKKRSEEKQLEKSSKALKDAGIDVPSGLTGEERKLFISESLKGKRESAKFANQLKENEGIIKALEEDRGLPEGSLKAYNSKPEMAERITKPKVEKPEPKSESQKLIEKETAKGYIEARNDIPKLDSALQNIGRLKELGEKLTGVGGYIKSALNTASASEYNTLGASLLEPVIKVFNPVGAVPTSKLNWIKETFSPKSSDLKSTQEGKIATLERLATQAKDRAQKKMKLFDDFNGNPPDSEVLKFDNDSAKMLTDFIDNKQYVESLNKEVPAGKILMLDPNGKPLHVNPNDKTPDGKSLIEFYLENGARMVNE